MERSTRKLISTIKRICTNSLPSSIPQIAPIAGWGGFFFGPKQEGGGGYTVDQVRGELSEFLREAERRHLAASRYQAEASEMRVDNLEQQAMKNHYEVVGRLESNISKIEVRAADRDRFLVSELQSLQEQNMAMQRDHAGNVAIAEAIQAQRLQTVYSNEMVEFRRSNSEFLSEQFSEQFSKFKMEELLRMSLTEDQMQAQNDELQEELASAEKALKFYRETAKATDIPVPSTPLSKASGYTGLLTPPGISAPQGPQVLMSSQTLCEGYLPK